MRVSVASGKLQDMMQGFSAQMLPRLAITLLFVSLTGFLFLFLAVALARADASVQVIISNTITALVMSALVGTVVFGLAVTAVVRPLRPVAETSVLGRRAVAFAKFGLAAGTLFATAYISWLVATSYDYHYGPVGRGPEPTGEIASLLGAVLVAAIFVYLIWLSVDLIRIGRRRRRNAIDYCSRRLQAKASDYSKPLRVVGRVAMSRWWWILMAFYLGPAFALFFGSTVFRDH